MVDGKVEKRPDLVVYQSIKRVRAGEITEVVEAGCYVRQADGTTTLLEYQPDMTVRYKPKVGDFWVVYEGDGYASISPGEVFRAGYRAIDGA